MNAFMHRNVTAALPAKLEVRQIAKSLVGWYRPRHGLLVEEISRVVQGEEQTPAPQRKLRFAV